MAGLTGSLLSPLVLAVAWLVRVIICVLLFATDGSPTSGLLLLLLRRRLRRLLIQSKQPTLCITSLSMEQHCTHTRTFFSVATTTTTTTTTSQIAAHVRTATCP
jgi:hypothetical protein